MNKYIITINIDANEDWEIEQWLKSLHRIANASMKLKTSFVKEKA